MRGRPRSFDETAALHSPEMSRVFSGGCVYEMWQDANDYGLVQMLPPEDPENSREWRAHSRYSGQVVDRRETDWGTLLVYEDFQHYRDKLMATKDTPTTEDTGEDDSVPSGHGVPEYAEIPESCVEWDVVEEIVRARGGLSTLEV